MTRVRLLILYRDFDLTIHALIDIIDFNLKCLVPVRRHAAIFDCFCA